jgi:predicted ABC-type ATPase
MAGLRDADPPILWIVGGANGSGKSSAFERLRATAKGGTVWIIDPDKLARRIGETENKRLDDANLLAVQRLEKWLYASVDAYQNIGVETVLSTDKYLALVRFAKERSMLVRLVYVLLASAEMNIERVRMRVAKGGHAVPEDRIVSRRARSLALLPRFLAEADDAFIFDNSGASPNLVGGKNAQDGKCWFDSEAIPPVVEAVKRAETIRTGWA